MLDYRECVFFFQAEDGIRDYKVTGVQTCSLPICRLLHLRVFEKFRILLRLVIEATLRLFHGGGLAIDFRGSLPQGGLLVRDRLLAGNEFGLPVLERATLALELLVDPRRIFVALAELALQGLDLDLLLADFLLLRENLRLPILQ